jgi:hypothetical protein
MKKNKKYSIAASNFQYNKYISEMIANMISSQPTPSLLIKRHLSSLDKKDNNKNPIKFYPSSIKRAVSTTTNTT